MSGNRDILHGPLVQNPPRHFGNNRPVLIYGSSVLLKIEKMKQENKKPN